MRPSIVNTQASQRLGLEYSSDTSVLNLSSLRRFLERSSES